MSETQDLISEHWNPFPECAGLELSAPQSGQSAQSFGLNAELIFGQQPLSGEGVSFRLGVKRGFLRVELEGCHVVPDTRFAVRDQPATVQREVKKEETQSDTMKAEGSAGGRVGVGSKGVMGDLGIGGKASGSRAKERKTVYRQEGTEEIHKVTARGTNTEPSWEIGDPENPVLDGRYLGLENLSEVAAEAEAYQITASFVCQKRDLHLNIDDSRWRDLGTNKTKLALVVIAKRLKQEPEGDIKLCKSVLTATAVRSEG